MERSALAGGLVSRACNDFRRTGRSSVQRLQADWSVERAVLACGLVGRGCSACSPTDRSKVPPRLQVDWSVQHTGACRRADLATFQRCWRTVQSCVHRLRGGGGGAVVRAALAGGLVDRPCSACRRAGRSSVQRLQADWSVERATISGGLVGGACNDFRRTGRSSVQRLQPNWSVKPSAIAVGQVSGAFSASRWTGQSSVQRLQAGLVGQACSDCRRAGQWSPHRFRGDWSAQRAALAAELVSEAFSACMRTG